jgi:hypothetical protein
MAEPTTPQTPPLTVCIVTWNCRDLALDCLHALLDEPQGADFDVVVVDNASDDGTAEAVRQRFPLVRLIANPSNRGFAAANNQGLLDGCSEFVFLLNPDALVPAGGLGELVRVAADNPDAGAVGPKLVNPDGSLQYSCRRFPRPWAALFRATVFGKLVANDPWTREYLMVDWPHDEVREVDWISGAAMLLRRRAIEEVGLLDERFFWGSEDVDYCKRLWDAGWKVMYTPRPAIIHRIGGSTDRAVVRTIYRRHASWYRLYSKHFSRGVLGRFLLGALIWLRALGLIASWLARYGWSKLKALLSRPKAP